MKAYKTLLKTELKLSLRGMDMLIFAVLLPLVILIILGIIYGDKPAFAGADYTFIEQSFGALASIAICAGGVMGLPLVISDYRSKKILKRYKVTPVSPALLLLVQVTVYILYAITSFLLLFFTAMLFFGFEFKGNWASFIFGYLLVMLSMFSIGILVGGVAPNAKIAGIIASALYFPMLIFSGATLPYEIMPVGLQKVANLLPLTQGIKLLKSASLGTAADSLLLPTIIMIVIAVPCIFLSLRYFRWE